MTTKRPPRVNLQINAELKKWYDDTADQLGLSTTAFMTMALTQVKEGTEKAKAHFIAHQTLPKIVYTENGRQVELEV